MRFEPATSHAVAHALHVLALTASDRTSRAYQRQDAALRAHLGAPAPARPSLAPPEGVLAALASPADPGDAAWFATRWAAGEEEAAAAHARRLADEAAALAVPEGLLPDEPATVLASPAVGAGRAAACPGPWRVVAGARSPGVEVVAAVVAARVRPALARLDVDVETRAWLGLHLAASLWLRAAGDDDDAFAALLPLANALLPQPGEEARGGAAVHALAPLLDQPPGEVARVAEGLDARRLSRVRRAWRRGFFAPAGATPEALLGAARDLGSRAP